MLVENGPVQCAAAPAWHGFQAGSFPGRFTDTDLRPASMGRRASRPCACGKRRAQLRSRDRSERGRLECERGGPRLCSQSLFAAALLGRAAGNVSAQGEAYIGYDRPIARRSAPERPHSAGKAHAKVGWPADFIGDIKGLRLVLRGPSCLPSRAASFIRISASHASGPRPCFELGRARDPGNGGDRFSVTDRARMKC
jgi:hypothetical protein